MLANRHMCWQAKEDFERQLSNKITENLTVILSEVLCSR